MSLGYQNRMSDRSISTNNLCSGRLLTFRNSLENVLKALKTDVGTFWGITSIFFAFSVLSKPAGFESITEYWCSIGVWGCRHFLEVCRSWKVTIVRFVAAATLAGKVSCRCPYWLGCWSCSSQKWRKQFFKLFRRLWYYKLAIRSGIAGLWW